MPRLAIVIKFLISLAILFLGHRILSFPFLLSGFEQAHENVLQIFVVGFMSDLWVAGLSATVVCLIGFLFGRWALSSLVMTLFGAAVATTVLHQAYVEFFRFQVIPYHLEYLLDRDFIRANSSSLIAGRALFQLSLGAGLLVFQRKSRLLAYGSNRVRWAIFVPVALATLATHAMNIHFRVQLFVPESLQMNVFEKLATDLAKTKIPPRLTRSQHAALAQHLGIKSLDHSVETLLTRPIAEQPPTAFLTTLKGRFQELVAKGEKPVIAVILSESLRTSEVGVYGDGSKPSITPELDALAGAGVIFRNAYSTGTVTRGAQEAVFCGFVGGMSTSLMRNRPDAKIRCLPDLTSSQLTQQNAAKTVSFWHHGGEGRFDGQLSFWSKRGVNSLVSYRDFDKQTPQTDWGYSDHALFALSLQKISALRSRSDTGLLYGVILTVTNHIPWNVPSDAPSSLPSKGVASGHGSYHSTAYADFAIGSFVRGLKESQIWSKTILVIVGDHGNLIPPYQKVLEHRGTPEELQTSVPLILSGGIVEATTRTLPPLPDASAPHGKSSRWMTPFVSQADIAPLLAFVLGLDKSRFIGELPFASKRRAPVMSGLGQGVYFPEQKMVVSDKDLMISGLAAPKSAKDFAILYYRGFLQLLAGN